MYAECRLPLAHSRLVCASLAQGWSEAERVRTRDLNTVQNGALTRGFVGPVGLEPHNPRIKRAAFKAFFSISRQRDYRRCPHQGPRSSLVDASSRHD
jgi:hypothetical protein